MAFQTQNLAPGQASNSFFAATQAVDALNLGDLGEHFIRAADSFGDSIIAGIDGMMNSAAGKAMAEMGKTDSVPADSGVSPAGNFSAFGTITPTALPVSQTAPEMEAPNLQSKLAGLNVAGLSMMSMSPDVLQPGASVQSGVGVAVSKAMEMGGVA